MLLLGLEGLFYHSASESLSKGDKAGLTLTSASWRIEWISGHVRSFANIWYFQTCFSYFTCTHLLLSFQASPPGETHEFWRNGQSRTLSFANFTVTRLPLFPWKESHPSCCHVNHRPTGSRLFTLVSLPPRFDYCNCLSTVCSAGFHTSSSYRDREWWWAVWVTVRGEASNIHREQASDPLCPSSPHPCLGCWSSNCSFYFFFGLL